MFGKGDKGGYGKGKGKGKGFPFKGGAGGPPGGGAPGGGGGKSKGFGGKSYGKGFEGGGKGFDGGKGFGFDGGKGSGWDGGYDTGMSMDAMMQSVPPIKRALETPAASEPKVQKVEKEEVPANTANGPASASLYFPLESGNEEEEDEDPEEEKQEAGAECSAGVDEPQTEQIKHDEDGDATTSAAPVTQAPVQDNHTPPSNESTANVHSDLDTQISQLKKSERALFQEIQRTADKVDKLNAGMSEIMQALTEIQSNRGHPDPDMEDKLDRMNSDINHALDDVRSLKQTLNSKDRQQSTDLSRALQTGTEARNFAEALRRDLEKVKVDFALSIQQIQQTMAALGTQVAQLNQHYQQQAVQQAAQVAQAYQQQLLAQQQQQQQQQQQSSGSSVASASAAQPQQYGQPYQAGGVAAQSPQPMQQYPPIPQQFQQSSGQAALLQPSPNPGAAPLQPQQYAQQYGAQSSASGAQSQSPGFAMQYASSPAAGVTLQPRNTLPDVDDAYSSYGRSSASGGGSTQRW